MATNMSDSTLEGLDLQIMERQLLCAEPGAPVHLPWLIESYARPDDFWPRLVQAQQGLHPRPAKSIPFVEYDLYHDAVTRHLECASAAVIIISPDGRHREISYAELAKQVDRAAGSWYEQGARAGQILCVIRPEGLSFFVSVLAAVKLGMILSVLPPLGGAYLRRRLEMLSPDHIETAESYGRLIPAWKDRLLCPVEASSSAASHGDRSFAYRSNEEMARLFDPSCKESQYPRTLSSDAAYLEALRDGLLTLGLRRGQASAAPVFHLLEIQPAMLWACLLSGGTYVYVEPEAIQQDSAVLRAVPVRAMGISTTVRDTLINRPVPLGDNWGFWYRNPAESLQLDRWREFVERTGLKQSYAANVRWEAAMGGCTLLSRRFKGQITVEALPGAGIQWQLDLPADHAPPAPADYGLLALGFPGDVEDVFRPTANIIARSGSGWIYAASSVMGHHGRSYPRQEVLEVLQVLQTEVGRYGLSLCVVPQLEGQPTIELLVFTGSSAPVDEASFLRHVRQRIEGEMGAEFLPDRIRCFPLLPRRKADGEVDHDWCEEQLLSGALQRKARDELYGCLTLLRETIEGHSKGSEGIRKP